MSLNNQKSGRKLRPPHLSLHEMIKSWWSRCSSFSGPMSVYTASPGPWWGRIPQGALKKTINIHGDPKYFIRSGQTVSSELVFQGKTKNSLVWKDSTVIKRTYCSCRGPEVSSQHPYQVANNHLKLQLQRIQCPLLASAGTCTHMYIIHRHRDLHRI